MDSNTNYQGYRGAEQQPPVEPQPDTDGGATRSFPQGDPTQQVSPPPAAPTAYQQPSGNGNIPAYHPNGAATPTPPSFYRPAARTDRDRTLLAIILIGAGVLFLLGNLPIWAGFGQLIPLLIGLAFMYAYFNTRPAYRIGFLIPGAILTGIGVGVILENMPLVGSLSGGGIVPVTLGLGFCLIWLLERKHWWALIPGGILVVAGLSSMWAFGALWPLVLIVIGGYLLYDRSRRAQPR